MAEVDNEMAAAVGFLDDVAQQNWNEADLKRYLRGTRGLSNSQVKEAFRIHRNKSKKSRNAWIHNSGYNDVVEEQKASRSELSGPTDRSELQMIAQEVRLSEQIFDASDRSAVWIMNSKKKDGEKLIDDFLVCEGSYCCTLECLNDDYIRELREQAGRGSIHLEEADLQEIVHHIPKLLKFHQSFYRDLMTGPNIGRLFIRRLNFFKMYADYLKDATLMIEILRKHIFDKKLQKCITAIRKRTRNKRKDFIDLLLSPLDRMVDYQIFLDKLLQMVDKSQEFEYQYFEKAARRIGRVAKYIETYRHGVINRGEMIRVQQYIGNQCFVMESQRSIVRRGVLTRRTSGWTARNKKYHFFLFTDVLLWTTKSGILKNIVKLSNCELFSSTARGENKKKFKILVKRQRSKQYKKQNVKVILLEAKTQKQREIWYKALNDTIASLNDRIAASRQFDEFVSTLESTYYEDLSSRRSSVRESEPIVDSAKLSNLARETTLEDLGGQIMLSAGTRLDSTYHDRYESQNFIEQKFQELEPMEESESKSSEYDYSFFKKFGTCNELSTKSPVSGPNKHTPENSEDQKSSGDQINPENGDLEDLQSRRSSCIIKRESIINKPSSNDENEPQRASSFTLRLSDEMVTSQADLVISLSGVGDSVRV